MEPDQQNRISLGQYGVALTVTSVTLMELLDTTILNTALPAIARSFNGNIIDLRMAITAYLATLAIFIPISGWVADRVGPQRTLLAATALFTCSSVMCGLSSSLGPFILFRILQGIGGAMMTPVSRIILVRLFRGSGEENFQKVTGFVAIPIVFGPLLGPVLGGWLTTHLSWHWIFFVNLPIGLMACFFIARLVKNEPQPEVAAFDLSGFLLAGSGLALISVALEIVEDQHVPFMVSGAAALIGLVLMGAAIRHSLGRSGAIFELGLFRIPSFRSGALLTLFGTASQVGMQALLPTMFQLGFGLNAFQSGLLTVATVIGVVTMKPLIPTLFKRYGYHRVLTAYPLLIGLTLLSFRLFSPGLPYPVIMLVLFLYGFWLSIHGNVINVIPYLDVPHEQVSRASSLQNTLYQFSLSLGIGFGALLLQLLLVARGGGLLTSETPPTVVLQVFHDSFTICGLLACCVTLIGARYQAAPKATSSAS